MVTFWWGLKPVHARGHDFHRYFVYTNRLEANKSRRYLSRSSGCYALGYGFLLMYAGQKHLLLPKLAV